jgi:CheY-like chemotaxis protein
MKQQVMLVDDEAGVLALVSIILQRGGYAIQTARDAKTALKFVDASPPDLFVLDLMMPGIDGLELCRRLSASPRTAHADHHLFSAQ